ncbi:MAG: HYR domain-containing protein [Verrucomicrobiota bacterium]
MSVTFPKVNYLNNGVFSLSYTPTNQLLSINTTPTTIVLAPLQTPNVVINPKSLTINIVVDNTGTLVGSAPGDGGNDLVLSGTVKLVVGGVTNAYTGVLLTGQVFGFGYLPGLSSQYDFRFTPNGGPLASLFCGNISVTMASEASTFTGNFTTNFNGRTKGIVGSEDLIPPTIVCPPDITAQCHFTNGLAGTYVSYPTPAVTDNCDPNPTVVCTPPSGSFFALPPPPANSTNYVVTCVATDAAGNTNVCTFNITVQDTLPPEFADTNNPVVQCGAGGGQIILTNDPGECYATFTFPIPTATDCCGDTDTVSVSAMNENGATIILTNLGNGMLQGEFPVDVTGTNLITVTADDGRGNTAQCQTPVLVMDTEPPTLFCSDQTVTFKPILTNALSCIEADFDDVCIASNNYLWFSSVIKNPSCWNKSGSFTVHIFDQTIQLTLDNTNITLDVPDAYVTFSNGVATSTATFTNGQWFTCTKSGLSGNVFASGLKWQVPFDLNKRGGSCWGRDRDRDCNFRRHVNSATWCARFAVDTPGITIQWQWGAVVQTSLTNDCNALGVKPVDDNRSSCWKNTDPAGSCENFKSFLTCGGRGKGWCWYGWNRQPDCTGVLSDCKRANLGMGTVCLGAVEFTPPLAIDNCGKPVSVVCTPPPGSILGPGVYTVTAVATDSNGNTNQCTFNLTVLSPLQVVFDTPPDDNLDDNTAEPDAGFSDMNCPDDPSTTEIVTRFCVGDKILHAVRLLDCNGNDVTSQEAPYVTVHIDVTEREGTYNSSLLVNDVPLNYVCVGSAGGIMVPNCGEFQYNLNTSGFQAGTINSDLFFRSCVWVEYNSSRGVPVGMEDVILESK